MSLKKLRLFILFMFLPPLCVLPSLALAKELNRAPLFGLAPVSAQSGEKVVVRYTLPEGTASQLGIQENDEVVSVNGTAINDFSGLMSALQGLSTGARIHVDIKRNDKMLALRGSMLPKPYETSEFADVVYGSVSHNGDYLRSITYLPRHLEAAVTAPAIYFLQGYTCDSIDYGMLPNVTTRQMIEQFVAAGYVVFRSEKPGVGDTAADINNPQKRCSQLNFSEENAAFLSGLKTLKSMTNVDPSQVYLWGHSLGVLHAAVLANNESVAGVIGYGGVYKNWHDYMLDIYRVQAVKHFGADQQQANENAQLVGPFLQQLLKTDTPWQDIVDSASTKLAYKQDLLAIDGDQFLNRHYSFFRDINQIDFAALWHKIPAPVFMMHGSLDIQAIGPDWTDDIVNANQNQNSKALVVEGAEHAFMRYDNQQQYMAARNNRSYSPARPGERFDPRIADHTLAWITSLKGTAKATQFSGINKLTFFNERHSKAFVGNGFLIKHKDKVYAVTVKHALLEAKTPDMNTVDIAPHVSDWRIHPNQQPEQYVRLGKLLNASQVEVINMAILQKDWLLFEVKENKSPLKVLTLRESPLSAGETLSAFGCSYKKKDSCTQDIYSGVYLGNENANLRIAMPNLDLGALRGLSGSPVLDENQQVVGIVSNVLRAADGTGFDFAPANLDYLMELLNEI